MSEAFFARTIPVKWNPNPPHNAPQNHASTLQNPLAENMLAENTSRYSETKREAEFPCKQKVETTRLSSRKESSPVRLQTKKHRLKPL